MITIEILEFINKEELSIEQFLLLQSVYARQTGEKRYSVHANLYDQYRKHQTSVPYKSMALGLIERGYLELKTSSSAFKIKDLRVTDKFISGIYVDEIESFKEAMDCYPDYINVNGVNHFSKIHKNGVEYLRKRYFEKVTKFGSKKEHNAFIKLVSIEYKGKKVAPQKFDYVIENWEILKQQLFKKHMTKLSKLNQSYDRQR